VRSGTLRLSEEPLPLPCGPRLEAVIRPYDLRGHPAFTFLKNLTGRGWSREDRERPLPNGC